MSSPALPTATPRERSGANVSPCPSARDHFHANGSWNDDGLWWCNGCNRFLRYRPGEIAERMREDAEDREDRRAITTTPERER